MPSSQVTDYIEIEKRAALHPLNEYEIWLILKNPFPENVNCSWQVYFPFEAEPKESFRSSLQIGANERKVVVKTWTTCLSHLPPDCRDSNNRNEIRVQVEIAGSDGRAVKEEIRMSLQKLELKYP